MVGTFRCLLGTQFVLWLKMYAITLTCYDPHFKSFTRPTLSSFALPPKPLNSSLRLLCRFYASVQVCFANQLPRQLQKEELLCNLTLAEVLN